MKITLILIIATSTAFTAPTYGTCGISNIELNKDFAATNAENFDLHTLKKSSSYEEFVTPGTKTSNRGQQHEADAAQSTCTFNSELDPAAGLDTVASSVSSTLMRHIADPDMLPKSYAACEVPVSQDGLNVAADQKTLYPSGMPHSRSDGDVRKRRNTFWTDTERAVSHYKVSEDYPEQRQGNRHVISKDYPMSNLVRVTLFADHNM